MISAQDPVRGSSDGEQHITEETRTTSLFTLTRLQALFLRQKTSKPSYPPISSIPRTSPDRLSAPDASPSPFPDEPIPATSLPSTYTPPGKPPTVLYLAYGSNLCAQTFLGQRGIRPISQVNVSCPSLDLTFDLPGIPYVEPCFANTAPRKVPKTPPKLPPEIPDPTKPPPNLPDVPNPGKPQLPTPSPPIRWSELREDGQQAKKEPVWDKGLIGVVYEVTKSDFVRIVATEGGGTGYKDILVPCLPLPANVGVPERPPEIPIPFLAHTLFAPQIPDIPDKDDDGDNDHHETTPSQLENQSLSSSFNNDKPKPPTQPHPPDLPSLISHLPPCIQSLFLPHSRAKSHPYEPYAQPSPRYLSLLITGAFEHDLPQDYQAYLSSLQGYTITSFRQKLGRFLTILFILPTMLPLMLVGQKFLTDPKTGKVPGWFGLVMNFVGNLIWAGYDFLGKRVFGDGERTEQEDGDDGEDQGGVEKGVFGKKKTKKSWGDRDICSEEDNDDDTNMESQSLLGQNRLLSDW